MWLLASSGIGHFLESLVLCTGWPPFCNEISGGYALMMGHAILTSYQDFHAFRSIGSGFKPDPMERNC